MFHKKLNSVRFAVFASGTLLFAAPVAAQNTASGNLVVDGKPVAITQVYAYAQKGFFDPTKDDVVILLCDVIVPPAAVRDSFARGSARDGGEMRD